MDKDELMRLCRDYVDMHGAESVAVSVFACYITGHLHTYTKRANEIVKMCVSIGAISVSKGMVYFDKMHDFCRFAPIVPQFYF